MGAQPTGTRAARRFEVVGCCLGQTGAVTHVGLLAMHGDIAIRTTRVALHDVVGPRWLGRDAIRLPSGVDMSADVLAWLPLSEAEEAKLEVWLADMKRRIPQIDYLVLPAHRVETDPVTGQPVRWRFSCAGFVAFAYHQTTGVQLVNQDALPLSEKERILEIWDNLAPYQRFWPGLGLRAPSPWPVLLPGHVLRALDSVGPDDDRSHLPYHPTDADAWFPALPPSAPPPVTG